VKDWCIAYSLAISTHTSQGIQTGCLPDCLMLVIRIAKAVGTLAIASRRGLLHPLKTS